MELLRNFLVLATLISSTSTQKTFKRACDCEYTIDGKCAYTLLLPKGQDTCSSQGGSTGTGGNSQGQVTSDVRDSLVELQTNVSHLWSASGDQARMLNQLQSMFITQQENMQVMLQNMSMVMSQGTMDVLNSSMYGDINDLLMNNITNDIMKALQEQFSQMGRMMSMVDQKVSAQRSIIDSLNKDVQNWTETLDMKVESLHQKMKTDYFLCHRRGLLVSGSEVNIPDDHISASSQFNENHKPARSRINTMADAANYGAWCPAEPNLDEWIQLDLGMPQTVYAVVTRGRPDYQQWVTQYKLQYTETLAEDPSETVWVTYKDLLNQDMLFEGNNDQNTQKINELWQPVRVRHVRIVPTAAYQDSNKCMRIDLLGCVDTP